MKFIAVRWVGLMTHHECYVDLPFLYHVTGVGENRAPPHTEARLWQAVAGLGTVSAPGMASTSMQGLIRLTETISSLALTQMVKEQGLRCRMA
jgi:hypothetical protein